MNISFFDQNIWIKLERAKTHGRATNSATKELQDPLSLSIVRAYGSDSVIKSWRDDDSGKVESKLTEAAVEIVVAAEIQYREGVVRSYEWRVKRRVELEQEAIKKKLEAEQAEKERLLKIEQARIDGLLQGAAAFRTAEDIRSYVRSICAAASPSVSSPDQLKQWSSWALAVADRIDPVVGGKFFSAMKADATG